MVVSSGFLLYKSVKKWVIKMFQGEYRHAVDVKGRIIIPSAIRNLCEGSVTIARGFDNCLALYTQKEWEPFCQKLLSLPTYKKDVRKAIRLTISSAKTCDFDKLGRINIPANLRKLAGIEKECVIIGAGNHAEIWSKERWDAYYEENEADYDDIFESLDNLEG